MDMDLSKTIVNENSSETDAVLMEHFSFVAGKPVPLVEGETAETSRIHYSQHMRFRFKYRNGYFVRDKNGKMIETEMFEKLNI